MRPVSVARCWILSFACAASAWLLSAPAQAAIINLPATDNAYVLRSAADANQNEAETVTVKGTGNDNTNTRLIFLRFDLSSVTLDPAHELVSAMLRLYHTSTSTGTHTLQVYGLLNSTGETLWDNSMTWNTRASGTDTASANVPNSNTTSSFASLALANTTPAGEIDLDLNLTAFKSFLNNDTNDELTLVLGTTSSGSPSSNFASITNTAGRLVPTLQLNVQAVPEPSTLVLLGMSGGLALLYGRRRKNSAAL